MIDKHIIEGCKKNDRLCQRALVDAFSPYLMGVCRRYLSDNARAQDCLQESLLKILTSLEQYREQGAFKSWAARITANVCLQNIRKEKKHFHFDIENHHESFEPEMVNLKLEVDDLMQFLDVLPYKYKVAINMFVVEGYSHKEVANRLEITESSSRSLVTRGRKMIQDAFEEEKMKVIHNSNSASGAYIKMNNKWSLQ